MKKCPICGSQYEHGDTCQICGILLIDTETNSAVAKEPQKKGILSTKKKPDKKAEKAPVVTAPVFEEPVIEEPVIEEPVIEEPVVKQPVVKKPEVKEAQEDIYGLGVKPDNSPKTTVEKTRSSNNDGKITISFHPAYAVAVVVIILLIVATVFIVRGIKEKREAEEMYQAMYEGDSEEPVISDELTDEEIAAQTGMAEEEEELAEPVADDTAIHDYQIIISDGSWYQAMDECYSRGGYLVRINSAEEFEYIADMLDDSGYSKYHFYLGGRRDYDGRGYFWVDENDIFMGELLNSPNSWANAYWYPGEPSFEDNGSDATGSIAENVMNLFCVKGTWYLNDSSDDMAYYYPKLLGGKIGYIVEYE